MRAVRVDEWNAPPRLEELPDPSTEPGHSIVRIEAATVGHIDHTIWRGGFIRPPARPYTPGVEGSGVIVEGGAYPAGTRVWVRGCGLGVARDGTWAELALVPDASLGPLPDNVDFVTGSAFFSPCTSAWVALHDVGAVKAAERVVITGASGAVGSIACQLALEAGATVIGVVSSAERIRSLPSNVQPMVVERERPVLDDGLEADLLIDTVGGRALPVLLSHVTPGGRAVLVGYVAGNELPLDLPAFIQRDVSLLPLNMMRREAS